MNRFICWLFANYDWVVGLLVQAFIAYHVFFLSQKLTGRARLEHREKIKKLVEDYLCKIKKEGLRRKVYIVNLNRYFKDYPSNSEKRFDGYSHIRADIKDVRFDGIEFFDGMPVDVYRKADGKLSFKGESSERAFVVFAVGLIPYEWIEYVDLEGDEYAYLPLFYCHFKGRTYWARNWKRFLPSGYPYKKVIFYRESDSYREGDDPVDMKWRRVDEEIFND